MKVILYKDEFNDGRIIYDVDRIEGDKVYLKVPGRLITHRWVSKSLIKEWIK